MQTDPRVFVLFAVLSLSCSGNTSSSVDAGPNDWPKEVELRFQWDDERLAGLRLEAGVLTPPEEADVSLRQAQVLSLRADSDAFCRKGVFEALSDIPTSLDSCPEYAHTSDGPWTSFLYLSASTTHTLDESYAIGTGALFRAGPEGPLYRLRILGDSYGPSGVSTALIEYEPVL